MAVQLYWTTATAENRREKSCEREQESNDDWFLFYTFRFVSFRFVSFRWLYFMYFTCVPSIQFNSIRLHQYSCSTIWNVAEATATQFDFSARFEPLFRCAFARNFCFALVHNAATQPTIQLLHIARLFSYRFERTCLEWKCALRGSPCPAHRCIEWNEACAHATLSSVGAAARSVAHCQA